MVKFDDLAVLTFYCKEYFVRVKLFQMSYGLSFIEFWVFFLRLVHDDKASSASSEVEIINGSFKTLRVEKPVDLSLEKKRKVSTH